MANEANTAVASTVKNFTTMLVSEASKKKINELVGDPKRGPKFISLLVNMVTQNPKLVECNQATLINAALAGYALDLNPQLGHFYTVPFNDRKNNQTVATFQMGYKGFIQLAIRSAQYKSLNAVEVKQGELKKYDRLTDEVEIEWVDDIQREKLPTVGYVAVLELTTGFKKTIYWSKEKMQQHAIKYSQGYQSDIKNGTAYTFWAKDFDAMAFKTMLRQIISKWGIMSIEMQNAYENDMAEINDGKPNYIDNIGDVKQDAAALTATKPLVVDESTGEVTTPAKDPFDEPKPLV